MHLLYVPIPATLVCGRRNALECKVDKLLLICRETKSDFYQTYDGIALLILNTGHFLPKTNF